MTRGEWLMCWQFVRALFRLVDCGDVFYRLTPHQAFAAHVLINRDASK